jgi:hypothetical protein
MDCIWSPHFRSQRVMVPSAVAAQNANFFDMNMVGYLSLLEAKLCVYVCMTTPESKLYRLYLPSLAVDIRSPSEAREPPSLRV